MARLRCGHDPLCFVACRQVVFVDVCKVGQSPLSGIITQLQAEKQRGERLRREKEDLELANSCMKGEMSTMKRVTVNQDRCVRACVRVLWVTALAQLRSGSRRRAVLHARGV